MNQLPEINKPAIVLFALLAAMGLAAAIATNTIGLYPEE